MELKKICLGIKMKKVRVHRDERGMFTPPSPSLFSLVWWMFDHQNMVLSPVATYINTRV